MEVEGSPEKIDYNIPTELPNNLPNNLVNNESKPNNDNIKQNPNESDELTDAEPKKRKRIDDIKDKFCEVAEIVFDEITKENIIQLTEKQTHFDKELANYQDCLNKTREELARALKELNEQKAKVKRLKRDLPNIPTLGRPYKSTYDWTKQTIYVKNFGKDIQDNVSKGSRNFLISAVKHKWNISINDSYLKAVVSTDDHTFVRSKAIWAGSDDRYVKFTAIIKHVSPKETSLTITFKDKNRSK